MAGLFDNLPAPLNPPTSSVGGSGSGARRLSVHGKPIGRPPGARNKGELDLGRYIAAKFGGMTPGQQAAELALVTPAEVKRAKRDAEELVKLGLMSAKVLELRLGALQLAQAVKAHALAAALGCEARDAYLLGQKERADLMPYVHQKRPIAPAETDNRAPVMYVASAEDLAASSAAAPGADGGVEILEDFDLPAEQVSQPKSHDDT